MCLCGLISGLGYVLRGGLKQGYGGGAALGAYGRTNKHTPTGCVCWGPV